MKVLIFNVNSHEGSTGMIAYNLLKYLREHGHKAKLLSGNVREDNIDDSDVICLNNKVEYYASVLLTRLFGYEGSYNYSATYRAKKIIDDFNPDVVQFYGMHAYWINSYEIMEYTKGKKIPAVYSMLDEFPYLGKCAYALECTKFQTECKNCPKWRQYPATWFFDKSKKIFYRKKSIYDGYENIVFTGPRWVIDRAGTSALMKGQRLELLNEPINYDDAFHPRDVSALRKELGIPDGNKVVLTVAVMSNVRKGGKYFIEAAERLKERKDISFVFVGYNVNTPAPGNVITIPFVKSQDKLAEFMALGDVLVCTSLADTMPNVCLDALGCGTPLCGFAEKGTPFCAPEPIGVFTPTYDVDALVKCIAEFPFKTKIMSEACVKYAHENFDIKSVFKRLVSIYNEFVQ